MKKLMALIIALLVVPMALATRTTERWTIYEYDESPIANHIGYFEASSSGFWENVVFVCTTKAKDRGFVVATVSDKSKFGAAIAKAKEIYASMKGAGGYDTFGCAMAKV